MSFRKKITYYCNFIKRHVSYIHGIFVCFLKWYFDEIFVKSPLLYRIILQIDFTKWFNYFRKIFVLRYHSFPKLLRLLINMFSLLSCWNVNILAFSVNIRVTFWRFFENFIWCHCQAVFTFVSFWPWTSALEATLRQHWTTST